MHVAPRGREPPRGATCPSRDLRTHRRARARTAHARERSLRTHRVRRRQAAVGRVVPAGLHRHEDEPQSGQRADRAPPARAEQTRRPGDDGPDGLLGKALSRHPEGADEEVSASLLARGHVGAGADTSAAALTPFNGQQATGNGQRAIEDGPHCLLPVLNRPPQVSGITSAPARGQKNAQPLHPDPPDPRRHLTRTESEGGTSTGHRGPVGRAR